MYLFLGGILKLFIAANACLLQFRSVFPFAFKAMGDYKTASSNSYGIHENCVVQSSFAALFIVTRNNHQDQLNQILHE